MTWQIHNVDCLDFLRTLPDGSVDAIVTDPPYGLGDKWRGGTRQWPLAANGKNVKWDQNTCDEAVRECLRVSKQCVVWGGHLYDLPPKRGWLLWDKKQGGRFTSGHAELAWSTIDQPIRAFRMSQVEAYCNQPEKKVHPTQKPLPLMVWCVSFLPEGCTILDPFAGSGTTGVACIQTGRNFIGCEIDPGYAEIARRRCREAEEAVSLLAEASP